MERLRNEIYDAIVLVFANTRGPERMKDDLISIMVDLAFMFDDGMRREQLRDSICLLLGLPQKKSQFSQLIVDTQRVVCTVDLINFHVDVIHSYCLKYVPNAMYKMLRSVLVCLGIFAQQESIDHFNTYTW